MIDGPCVLAFLLGLVAGYLVLPMIVPKLMGK